MAQGREGAEPRAGTAAIVKAKAVTDRPSLIIVRTIIGYGSPSKAGTAKAHGEPLGKDEIVKTKQALGWEWTEPFHVPEEAREQWGQAKARGAAMQAEWAERYRAWSEANHDLAEELERRVRGELPQGWEATIPNFTADNGNVASRNASGIVLNALAAKVPELVGGSADLSPSTLTVIKGDPTFAAGNYAGRNVHFGVREHGMGSIMNGMALHGGIVPYGATFLVFADYMRPAIRLAAIRRRGSAISSPTSAGAPSTPTPAPMGRIAARSPPSTARTTRRSV